MEYKEKQRTTQQNRALHLYFQLLADMLNGAGLDMKMVLKPEIDIPWTKQTVKDYLWRPIQKAYTGKRSTTELDKTKEINDICDILNRHLGEKFGKFGVEYIEFPSYEKLLNL